MKTISQKYREDMRRFALLWRKRRLAADLLLAIHFRGQARGWSGKATR